LALARALVGKHKPLTEMLMATLSIPIHIDTVLPGTATVLTTDELPGTVIVSVQAQAPVGISPDTLCFHLTQDDARRLHRALTACLKGTTN
jgi:hypothetical protein